MSISDNSNSSENSVDLIDLIYKYGKTNTIFCLLFCSFVAFSIYQLNNSTFTYDIYFKSYTF